MWKKFIPYAHAESVFALSDDWLINHHVKYLLVDLDNTLDSYNLKKPTMKAIEFKARLDKLKIKLLVLSNNTKKRVSLYAKELKVDYLNSLTKPFIYRLKKALKKRNINIEDSLMVGDQVVTDVVAGNRIGIRVILTDKLVSEDQPTTRFNRLFDTPIRKRLAKNNLLKEWNEV